MSDDVGESVTTARSKIDVSSLASSTGREATKGVNNYRELVDSVRTHSTFRKIVHSSICVLLIRRRSKLAFSTIYLKAFPCIKFPVS